MKGKRVFPGDRTIGQLYIKGPAFWNIARQQHEAHIPGAFSACVLRAQRSSDRGNSHVLTKRKRAG
jgi:hypothetical protein